MKSAFFAQLDKPCGGIDHAVIRDEIQQAGLAVRIHHRLMKRYIAVQWHVLLPRCCLNGCYYLPGYAKFGERSEACQAVIPEVPDGLVQADHSLLDNVIV